MLGTMDPFSQSLKRYQVLVSPNFGGEHADSVPASAKQWELQDHQHRMCLKISPHPILPAIRCHCPPEPITTAIDDPSNGQLVSPHYILVKSLNSNPNTHQWLSIWLRKNIGLHIHLQSSGNETWEYAQAITKFCRHNVSIPGADHHHCLTHRQGANYARFGLFRLLTR